MIGVAIGVILGAGSRLDEAELEQRPKIQSTAEIYSLYLFKLYPAMEIPLIFYVYTPHPSKKNIYMYMSRTLSRDLFLAD